MLDEPMQDHGPKPKRSSSQNDLAKTRVEVRSILHEFYIEIATTKMSGEKFDEFIDRIIDCVSSDQET